MAVSIDWGNALIHVPKTDLVPLGGLFYYHDTEVFLRELQALAASEAGAPYPVPYNHNGVVTLSGVAYARIVEILAPYQVVYDDSNGTDAYNVNLGGSNNNILDRKFPNLVTVNPNNSAGLTDVSGVTQALDYAGEVVLDPVNGTPGAQHPNGTHSQPVDNFADAVAIAHTFGVNRIIIEGSVPVDCDLDISNFVIEASSSGAIVNLVPGNVTTGTRFVRTFLSGTANGGGFWGEKVGFLDGVAGVHGFFIQSAIFGSVTLAGDTSMADSYSGVAGSEAANISGGNTNGIDFQLRRFTGGLRLDDFDSTANVSVDLLPGRLVIESTVTGGDFKVRGMGEPIDLLGSPDILDADGYVVGDDLQLVRKLLDNRQDLVDLGATVVMRTWDDDDATVLRDHTVRKSDDSKPDITQGIAKRGKGA